MPSLNLTDAWKDYTPPSPPDAAGREDAYTPSTSPAPGPRTSFFLSPETTGLLAPGNINLRTLPVIHNPDGTVSIARTLSIAKNGRQYLIPTVSDEGELLSDQDAITRFEQTGRHLGAFKTLQDATGYANRLHRQQEILYAATPENFQGREIQNRLPVTGFPEQTAVPLSPPRPRPLFDQPLTTPLISTSARLAPAFQPDPQRMEQLHALILHGKQDPELDALLETNPAFRAQAALDDGSLPARALLGQQILREIAGDNYASEPGLYFLALKEKLPEAATRQEAYAAVYDHYAKTIEKQYQENKARKAAYQKNRKEVESAVAKVIGSFWTPADLNTRLTPEQIEVYQKEFDTTAVEKAHAAFSILKQTFSATPEEGLRRMISERTAMRITSALSENDGTGKLTISETVFGLFEGTLHTLMEETKEESGDKYKFLHNLRIALFNPVIKRDATLGTGLQLSGQQQLLVPFAKEHNAQVLDLMSQTVRDYETYIKNDRENARVLGLLSTGQDLGNQANDRAPFAARTINCLGSVCGQTAPFFLPYAGWGVALAGAYDDKRNRAYYAGLDPGTAEWSAFIDAASSVAVEKISYGAVGRLSGAGWLMGKLPFMGKARKTLTDSLWKHILFETGAGIVEETLVEPTAEAVIQWAVRNGIAPLAGINAGGAYDWNNYWQELKSMLEPDQLLATALFVGGLAGTQSAIMQRTLITHSRSPEMLMTQGIPEDEAKRIAQIPDNGQRISAVREAVTKLKTLPPEEVRKNSAKGAQAFRSLTEVRATVESEAYKYFQQSMHLPLVEEKLDKPGTYAVTIFSPDTGQKKFTQEMTEDQLTAHFGQHLKSEQRAIIAQAQSDFAANAFMRTVETQGVIQTQDMLQWSRQDQENAPKELESATKEPEDKKDNPDTTPQTTQPPDPAQETSPPATDIDTTIPGTDTPASAHKDTPSENLSILGQFIRTFGSMGQTGFSYLTRVALDEWNHRLASGLSGKQAGAAPFSALSPYVPLSSMLELEEAFKKRLGIAAGTTGEEKNNQTNLFQMRTAPGTTPADILFLVSKGLVSTREMLEDLFEVGIKKLVKGEPARLEAMGTLLRETQAGLQKLGFQGQFISPTGPLDEMKVVEAMSKLALSDTLANADTLPLPQWQKDLLQYHVNYLQDASWLLNLGHAWNLGRKKDTITRDMEDILRDLGHQVHTLYDQAKIEQQDIQAVMEARALTGRLDTSGILAASEIRERQQKDAEKEKKYITTGDRSKERPIPQAALQRPETLTLPQAPSSVQGVFANGASWNPDAGTWLGMVPVDKLHLSPEVPQVKVNSGKKGVVNPLVGDYRADASPVYVWKRKNGRLEVVSGRHRLDLAQRTGTKNIPAYVYEEDAAHDAKWARLLDYEQNMQDDQADELTAAIYVRETSLTDDELTRRGLTRSGTKSRRGLLIGREAREDLWTRFKSGAIRAQDAEAICLLTQHIQDKARIDAMQTAAANDLARGKSLEFVAAKIQLMAHASADSQMVQGLISFGESFEADMEKAAEYVSLCITTINEHINAIKGVRTISKKGSVLATEGITAGLSADPAERLKELELLKAMYEKIGLYENLRVRALTWDGHTPPDPIGDHRLDMQAERARAEADAAALEDEENRKVAEKLTPEFSFSLSPSSFFSPSSRVEAVFPFLWRQAEKELNDRGNVSFALNGTRVSIHSLSEKNFREALETGGVLPPVNRGEDFPSGAVNAGEIACVLHPESVDGSGKRVPLSDFSGFIIPSSQENSLYAALMELGVPVRVYHVTEEETAFLEDPQNMKKEGVERDRVERNGLRRRELEVRRNNVIRSFLEETDVSFSLSAEERRIFTRARREDTWMKAPDGTPTALTERQWLQVHSDAFKEWFGESKIVNEHGEPVVVYHGTARADRVGTVFRGDRATSGPMAFFTDHENIAANYARDKGDTSIAYEEEDYYDYHQQFRITLPSGKDISLERYWHYLSPAEQRRITTLAGQIREDWDGDNSIIVDPSINDANGGFPYHLQEARGNAFRALVIQWLESAILLDEEHRFLDVLEKLDLPLSPYYRDPDYREPKVYACYMRMEHPFRTARITKKIISSLKAASKKAEMARESWRTDLWDKNSVSPGDWIERLEGDYENKTTRAWTSIPDWVTACLRKNGYDGIIDQGGKFHAEDHIVCIPFDSGQIKSATDNRGTFDPGSPDITFSLWNSKFIERAIAPLSEEERLILRRARDGGNYMLAPNGQPSRLTEKQWAQSRTKAFLDWYGDWLHDPANASKTLDENGEPIVLYHGGSFDIRRSPSVFDGVPHVDGIFFSDSTELAKSYQAYQGGSITTAWLNLKNPFPAQNEAGSRLPWVDRYIDFWQEEEGWTERYSGESMDRESVRDMIREGSLYEYDMGQRWSDFLGWVREHHDGYLGHDPTDMGALIAVAFKSIQVKSSEYNSGAFSASEPDITFSLSNLAAIHSLDEEKFLAVDKLGGLPLPSIAVTRLDRPYTWGGEENIYLVGSPALADPAHGVEIHDRDAWSGYFPELRWSRQEENEREDFYNRAQEAALRYYGGTDISSLRFLKNALDGDHRGELENKLRHNDSSLAVFAAERGYAPRPVTAKIPGRLNTGDKIFYSEIRKMLPWKDANTLSPDRQDDFCKAMERAIERYRSQFSQDSRDAQLTVPQTLIRKSNLRGMEKELREARGDGFQSISYLALQDARQAGKKALDSHANYKRFEKYAAQHKKAFNAWVEDKLARWLNPVPRIRETGLPATLENITRHMLESKGMGAERGLVFSTGLLRARQARRFNSLEEIKASRNNLVITEEEKASRQKAQDLIHQFQMALSRIDGSFSAFDNAVKALSLVRGAPTPQKVLAALCRLYRGTSFQGRIARDSRLPGLGSAALSALHAELRDYYEAVPRRSVQLREFSHAVLPAALRKNKQVRDVLKRHQIRPLYHDGTREGRFQALASLIGSSASFSLAPGPSWLRLPDSDYMASLSEEERAITETALASGTWLKAPNGEPSRLTPRQWAQVRTAAFHDWFGDWQHDPAHASLVVDENGEPRVVYHGTHRAGFTVFDSRKGNPSSGIPAGSSFFTADPEVAASYYGIREKADLRSPLANTGVPGIYSCFLNFRSPLEEDFGGLWWYEKGEPWFDLYDKQSGSYISPPDGGEYWTSEQAAIDYISSHGLTDYMLIRIFSSRTIHTVVEEAKLLHRDGAVIHNVIDPGDDTGNKVTDTYVALHPSQIKSATDNIGTFDPSSPDITFSVIGPHAATWGQYKKNTFRGRDDGMYRAEIDASRAALKDRAAPYLPTLRRELSALRHTLSAETKKRIARYLSLHRQFYRNKRTLRPENNISKWREYLTLDHDRESWGRLLSAAVLRTGPFAASGLAEQVSSLELLLREDDGLLQSLATLAAANTALPLDAWLDYPELFAAYPALRSMPVILQHLSGYLGMYSPAERAIYIHRNLDAPQQLRSILLHEIQHAIQHIEGFAKGGTRESAKLFYESMREVAYEAYDQASRFMSWLNARDGMISTLEYMLSLARNPRRVLRTSYRYSYDGISHRLTGEERILDMARYALKDLSGLLEQFYDKSWSTDSQFELPWPGNYALNTPAGIKECLAAAKATPSRRLAYRRTPKPDMAALHRDFLKYERLSSLSPYELYRRLAGEIEACAVERRSGLSAGECAESPFNDALEYPGDALVSFSLTSLEEIVSGLAAPSMQATRASELVKDFGKAAENWRRVMSGKEEKPSARVGAELFGMINALLSSARYVLPQGYRSNVDLQMQWASVYAAMAESGEIPPKCTLRSGDSFYEKFETSMINTATSAATPEEVRQILASIGSQRLDHVMSKILDRVRTQLVYFAKDELYQKTMRRVGAVYPKKEPGKKSPRGRLEAAAYRTLARYRQMLDAQSQAKAEAMTTLEALYNQEEDEEKRQEHERDILAWKTYGDYAGMSLPQAREAMEKLLEFVLSGRNSWERKLTREAGRTKYAARQIQKNLPAVNSGSSRAGAKISHRTKLRKLLSSLPYSVMSYAQLMLALEPVLGQRFSRARIKEITEANASLLNASNDRSAWLSGAIRRIAGVKSESAAEQWLVQFNTPQATSIPIAPVLTVKVSLSIEDAQEWISLSSQEREARRQAIREEDRRTETLTENVPGEEDIPLLRQALDEYESRTPEQRQYQHNVTSEREVPNTEAAGQLICSRDCALYAILLHEQPDYADVYDSEGNLIRKGFLRREGLDDKGIEDLYDYVGPDGLEYGYALRRKLNETGLTLARVYEERMGVPFTLKPDYFRATFDRNSTREKDALTEPRTGSIGGGKYGLLIDRIVHSENLDFSKSGTLVFLAAAAEQDNYIYTSHITTAWRALLKNKPLEQKLKQHLGEDMMGKLSSWMDLIDGANLENNRAFLNLSRMQGMLQKAFAISVLAGNGYVLLKQATAILHGFFAGWVPSAILEKADGTRELAHKHISFSSFLFHLAASKLGLGDIAMKEVAATPYFTARMRGEGAMLAQIGNQIPGQRYSRMEKLPEKSMDLIEAVDVKANLLAMHALANAYYARSRSLNRENGSPFTDEELRQAALEQVGMSLELGAQPLTKTQKSMSQAAGGILSKLAFIMKSEQLNKIGLMAAEWKTGSARNRVCAAQSWLALGVTSSLLAWLIAWIKGMDDDDDKEKKWKKYAASALLGDLTTIPLAGEGVNYLSSLFTGEPVFADSYSRTLIDVQGAARTVKKEYEHLADKKEMDWDQHFNNLTSLARAAGVGGAFSRSPSAVLSSYGALSLSAATGANISRTAKDLLTTLFRYEDPPRKKKKKALQTPPRKRKNRNADHQPTP